MQSLENAKTEFKKAVDHMKNEFGRLQVGRASSVLVENINVDSYGSTQPLKATANISIPDPTTIQIQPWDKGLINAIEKAIVGIGTGLNPQSDGNVIRINIPPLTEERRTELSKHVSELAENAKISVRTARQEIKDGFKQMKDNGDMTEDDVFSSEKKLQDAVDEVNKEIDELAKAKEQDIMTV